MTKRNKVLAALLMLGACGIIEINAQSLTNVELAEMQRIISGNVPENTQVGRVKIDTVVVDAQAVNIDLSPNFGSVPFTQQSIAAMRADMQSALGAGYRGKEVKLTVGGVDINEWFSSFEPAYRRKHEPFVTPVNKELRYARGLDGNIIALWPSHGLYFENTLNRWEWQRGRLLQTVEDMYTHSYVVSFLMPMLENAGCYVWDARERDLHSFACVADNDGGKATGAYRETNGAHSWAQGQGSGFAYNRDQYVDWQNPFDEGTFRQVASTRDKKKASTASWDVTMPQQGNYAVYVSYKSLPASVKEASYTINCLSGSHEVKVNQRMAGGVWVYVGTYTFAKGETKNAIVLSNYSKDDGVVTADAVKVGGGEGNIARRPAERTPENLRLAEEQGGSAPARLAKEGMTYDYISCAGHPWYTIGSRYYLQWAGFPRSVYSESDGINDYNDDYRSRGQWVNWLAGGSQVLPGRQGLNVPVDLSYCLHTDAGDTHGDDIVGTLTIYSTRKDGKEHGKYEDGTPRSMSRLYSRIVTDEVVSTIRKKYEPNWTHRGLRDASYFEARVPEVPALLMELLSHQNFADMKYGLDPNFRFDVSRALYKGMLKFIAQRDNRAYEVQPLPVNTFAVGRVSDDCFVLSWKPTADDLTEGGAMPTKYVVQERVGDGAFKEVATTRSTEWVTYVTDNKVHSYRVVAVNDGGRSFPSETLAVGVAKNSKGNVAVVNSFTRLSAPDWFDNGNMAGFLDAQDHGVDYVQQINYVGPQFEFDRSLEWQDDDDTGFGDSHSTHETHPIAGNTFDYAALHGQAILDAGYSFTSFSLKAFEEGTVNTADFATVDIIAGKQKEVPNGRGAYPSRYKLFSPAFMAAVTDFTSAGGNVLLTGCYVGSDVWHKGQKPDQDEANFAQNVLGYKLRARQASLDGVAVTLNTPVASVIKPGRTIEFYSSLNPDFYAAEAPDGIVPVGAKSYRLLDYTQNSKAAAVASDHDTYRAVVVGFPFETIKGAETRTAFMGDVLNYLNQK